MHLQILFAIFAHFLGTQLGLGSQDTELQDGSHNLWKLWKPTRLRVTSSLFSPQRTLTHFMNDVHIRMLLC